jgi:hypothetical protein
MLRFSGIPHKRYKVWPFLEWPVGELVVDEADDKDTGKKDGSSAEDEKMGLFVVNGPGD